MIYFFVRRGCAFLALAILAILLFQSNLMAEGIVLNHTGTIRVTRPDGVVLMIEPGQALPDIPMGSRVEVMSGSIEIEPSEGFVQVVVGGSVATVKAGDSLSASIDPKRSISDFKVNKGQANIISGNTTIALSAGQHAQIGLDKDTGVTTVKSIAGIIETVTVGVKAVIPEGAIFKMSADAKTRNVHIECVECPGVNTICKVITVEGKVIELHKGQSIDTPGSAEGEIQSFEARESRFEAVEVPPQPTRPEGSPYGN